MSEIVRLELERVGEAVIAHVAGEVDLAGAPDLGREIEAAVPNGAERLVLDLTATTYLDSAGIRLVFALAERLGHRGQALLLVVPEDALVERVLLLTGVDRVAPIRRTVEEALAPAGEGDAAG